MSDAITLCQTDASTLLDVLESQAEYCPYRIAYTFWRDDGEKIEIRVSELANRARAIAARLQEHVSVGDRVLLVFPPGLDFISAFLGCLYAGALAVPATYPKPRRPMPRLSAIAADCQPSAVLTVSQTLSTLEIARVAPELDGMPWIAVDAIDEEAAHAWRQPEIARESLAFLQYTSGSTSDPKGVMVSHGNLLHNLEVIRRGFAIGEVTDSSTGVFWLPAYHDMGLIGGILEPLYIGGHSVLMSPASFLHRPALWLQMISDFHGEISGAPNFAYDLCVEKVTAEQRASLDLSSWRVAFCGAEPIRQETLKRFAETFAPCGFDAAAFYPCYGMAEATLLAAGGRGPGVPTIKHVNRAALEQHRIEVGTSSESLDDQPLVSCGNALMDQEIVIADLATGKACPEDRVGEIWISGPSVADGYWNRDDENAATFGATVAGYDRVPFLRTGDLGFISEGHLYITGRMKDVMIIRGRNHYPQDIEYTAGASHESLQGGGGAAFSIVDGGEEKLVVMHEVRRERGADYDDVLRAIRRDVAREHEIEVHAVVLIRQASLPRTTSGKAQRSLCRERYLDSSVKDIARWVAKPPSKTPPLRPFTSNGHSNGSTSGHHANGKNGAASNGHPHHGNGHAANGHPTNGHATNGQATNGHATNGHGTNGHASNGNGAPLALKGRIAGNPQTTPAASPVQASPSPAAAVVTPEEVDRLAERIEGWLLDWLVSRAEVPSSELDRNKPLADYGLDSLSAVDLAQELERWLGIELSPVLAWNHPTASMLARYLAGEASRKSSGDTADAEHGANQGSADASDDFERLLAEIENLSDDQAESALE